MSESLLAVEAQSFETDVLNAALPTVVDFTAGWCPPCRAIAPALGELAAELADSVRVVTLDVDVNREIAARYGVRTLPTLIAFREGRPIAQMVGAASRDGLRAFLQKASA